VPGRFTPFLTALPIRLVACQLGRVASGDPFSFEYQAAYNSAIDLLFRAVSDRFLAEQIHEVAEFFKDDQLFSHLLSKE
jgi:hypothetical protein